MSVCRMLIANPVWYSWHIDNKCLARLWAWKMLAAYMELEVGLYLPPPDPRYMLALHAGNVL